ncbi:MAG: hypothetical protein A3C90_02500 [Candidatus Magasanikbacteria bacterium RIFCSPHIGHO2_02_FULL_51_14]|uniref:Uncharacterized protein n=1 Tax=Candidatus Magasanikbacteria bacterium RIFCSPHIGHO2_02_FULL_51_14 TaxID=1798683 RepID=A0A1F6MDF1_9BACT|nr:MAG: hypothetical protein A3C90_02500 [Candidatus Magasanikbacteria bacterium RIFCSPHIGHO2_02_FULL_51_14]
MEDRKSLSRAIDADVVADMSPSEFQSPEDKATESVESKKESPPRTEAERAAEEREQRTDTLRGALNVVTQALEGFNYRLGGSAGDQLRMARDEGKDPDAPIELGAVPIGDLDLYTTGDGFEYAVRLLSEEPYASELKKYGLELTVSDAYKFGASRRLALTREGKDVLEMFGEGDDQGHEGGTLQLFNPDIEQGTVETVRVAGLSREVSVTSKEQSLRQYMLVGAEEFRLGGEKLTDRFVSFANLLESAEPGMTAKVIGDLKKYKGLSPEQMKTIEALPVIMDVVVPPVSERARPCDDCYELAVDAIQTVQRIMKEELGDDSVSVLTLLSELDRLDLNHIKRSRDLMKAVNHKFRDAVNKFEGTPKVLEVILQMVEKIRDQNEFPANIFFRAAAHIISHKIRSYEQRTAGAAAFAAAA